MSVSTQSQKLPSKEGSIFKKIVRCYELKQYKNGLKFSRQILSNPKFSEHGETLAMKGLIMNCLGRKEEAYELVKKGLKNDLRSHVCWHVFGLLQRSDKKYDEAIKCYRNALKWDKDNVQILKDLSLLQIQMRDLEGFRDTRYQLLRVRPAQRSSWVGYSLSYLLLKDYMMAAKVISEYRKTTTPQAKPDTDFSELVLYEVQVMMEGDMYESALKHINSFESSICDTGCLFENKAAIQLALGQHKKAEFIYRDLVKRNPENYSYLEGLEKSLQLKTTEEQLALYEELIKDYPRSHCIKRMPLLISSGDVFRNVLDPFLRVSLHKGVPSLFTSLKPFYKDTEKTRIIGGLLSGYVESLRTCRRFHPDDSGAEEPPSSLLWSISLLAQHHDVTGQSLQSLELINEAIEHTPTDVQLYMVKARLFKHAGDLKESAQWMEEARTLDTADRYVNCKCVKYLFRIDQIDKAVETAGLFTRDGLHPLQTMDEMQCMWFQTEMAMAYWRLDQLGEALVKLHEIDKHFTDIIDDQFDFHTYCIRRTTLRAYVDVLRLEDHLRQHPSYAKAAKAAIEIYVYLHDNPDAKKGKLNGSLPNASEMSASELKKFQRKQKKAQLKAQAKAQEEKENKPQKQQQATQQQQQQNEEEKKQEEKEKFNPKELLEVENPLDEALKFLAPLQMFSRGRIISHLLAYSIHSRRRKFLLMLQSLKRSLQIDPENGELHTNMVDFITAFESSKSELLKPVRTVVEETLPSLTGGLSPNELNQQFLQKHSDSLDHLIQGGQVLYRLQPELRDKAVGYVTDLSDQLSGRTLENCLRVRDLLRNGAFGNCPEEAIQDYEQRCRQLFPLAAALKPPSPATAAEEDSAEGGSPDKQLPSHQQS